MKNIIEVKFRIFNKRRVRRERKEKRVIGNIGLRANYDTGISYYLI
jgi:hypothetical protein